MPVKRSDPNAVAKMKSYLQNMQKQKVQIGITKDTNARPDGNSNAIIGLAHEFGLGVPERSHLRTSILENASKYAEMIAKDIPDAIKSGKTAYDAYSILGTIAANDVKMKIASGDFTPLNAKTIERKKSSKPLIDTGFYRQSITYRVE